MRELVYLAGVRGCRSIRRRHFKWAGSRLICRSLNDPTCSVAAASLRRISLASKNQLTLPVLRGFHAILHCRTRGHDRARLRHFHNILQFRLLLLAPAIAPFTAISLIVAETGSDGPASSFIAGSTQAVVRGPSRARLLPHVRRHFLSQPATTVFFRCSCSRVVVAIFLPVLDLSRSRCLSFATVGVFPFGSRIRNRFPDLSPDLSSTDVTPITAKLVADQQDRCRSKQRRPPVDVGSPVRDGPAFGRLLRVIILPFDLQKAEVTFAMFDRARLPTRSAKDESIACYDSLRLRRHSRGRGRQLHYHKLTCANSPAICR